MKSSNRRGFLVLGLVLISLIITQADWRTALGAINGLILEGNEVEYIFFPSEPQQVSHGEFRLQNKSSEPAECEIKVCSFGENDRLFPIDPFWVYDGDRSLGRRFMLPANSGMEIRVTFAARPVHVGPGSRYDVRLLVECQGQEFRAVSRLNLTQER